MRALGRTPRMPARRLPGLSTRARAFGGGAPGSPSRDRGHARQLARARARARQPGARRAGAAPGARVQRRACPEQALASAETPRDLLCASCSPRGPGAAGRGPQASRARAQPEGVRPARRRADAHRGARVPRRAPARPPLMRFLLRGPADETETLTYRDALGRRARVRRRARRAQACSPGQTVAIMLPTSTGVPFLLLRQRCSRAASRCRSIRRRACPPSRTTSRATSASSRAAARRSWSRSRRPSRSRWLLQRAGGDAARRDDVDRVSGERQRSFAPGHATGR